MYKINRILALYLVMVLLAMSLFQNILYATEIVSDVKGTEYEKAVTTLENYDIVDYDIKGNFYPNLECSYEYFVTIMERLKCTRINVTEVSNQKRSITFDEVIVILIREMGYEPLAVASGGAPVGHMIVASEVGILKDVKGRAKEATKIGDVAKLIYNALEVPMLVEKKLSSTNRTFVVSGTNGTAKQTLLQNYLKYSKPKEEVESSDNKSEPITQFTKIDEFSTKVEIGKISFKAEKLGQIIENTVVLYMGSPRAYVNEVEVAIDDTNNKVVPVVINDRALLPVRFVSESLGAEVNWDEVSSTVVVNYKGKSARITVNSNSMMIDGSNILLDVPAQTIDGRVYIPLRRLCEDVLLKKVFYKNEVIIISDQEKTVDDEQLDMIIDLLDVYEGKSYPELYPASFGDKVGYINKQGEVVIQPMFERYEFPTCQKFIFSEGLAAVCSESGKFGFVDSTGKYIIEPVYDFATSFCEGRAYGKKGDKKFIIDRSGEIIIEREKDSLLYIGEFHDGLAMISFGGKYGYINKLGKLVIPIKFDYVYSFSEGFASAKYTDSNGKKHHGYINKKGEMVFEVPSDSFGFSPYYSEGLVSFKKNSLYGYMNKQGKIVIEPNFTEADEFSDGLACVKEGNGEDSKYGFIDKSGQWIIKPVFDQPAFFINDLCAINNSDSNPYVIDKTGNKVFNINLNEPCTAIISPYGLIEVIYTIGSSRGWFFYDESGNQIWSFKENP